MPHVQIFAFQFIICLLNWHKIGVRVCLSVFPAPLLAPMTFPQDLTCFFPQFLA